MTWFANRLLRTRLQVFDFRYGWLNLKKGENPLEKSLLPKESLAGITVCNRFYNDAL